MSISMRTVPVAIALSLALVIGPVTEAQENEARRQAYDQTLDMYVRDGFVYYRALKSDRGRLDAFVNSLAGAAVEGQPRDAQMAFWVNAYNALVLKSVIDHYPMQQVSKNYPARSLRQVPGAFERITHRVAGKALTLDQIEQTVLMAFGDPRIFLAIARGAVSGGRLRSEAYTAASLERQLGEAGSECLSSATCFRTDRDAKTLGISSIFSWREKEFVAAYADKAPPLYSTRSPIERAALALLSPKLLQSEKDFIELNEFKVDFIPFDWTLNDLTGRGGR